MADPASGKTVQIPSVNLPGLGAVPVVVVKLPNGQIALRHPSELSKTVPQVKQGGGGS